MTGEPAQLDAAGGLPDGLGIEVDPVLGNIVEGETRDEGRDRDDPVRPSQGLLAAQPTWSRCARFTAEMIALSDAVTIDESIPTPHSTRPPIAHSTNAAALASPPADIACSE